MWGLLGPKARAESAAEGAVYKILADLNRLKRLQIFLAFGAVCWRSCQSGPDEPSARGYQIS